MEENTSFKAPSAPGTPLQQLSPERINQMRIPQSPSVPAYLNENGRQRRESDLTDVKSKVAYLNGLNSQHGSPTRSPTKSGLSVSSHAAIQRAVLGREEAETALTTMTSQLDQAKTRERMVSERVEALMEQLQEARSRQRHERQVYEKEIKACKKSEYKAELAVIKLQEELKEIKNDAEGFKVRAEHDKTEKEKARQEAFERAYALAGLTEEMEMLKEKLKVTEKERDSAFAVAANAAPIIEDAEVVLGTAALHEAQNGKGKERAQSLEHPVVQKIPSLSDIHNAASQAEQADLESENIVLQEELMWVKSQLKREQDLVHFMNMQCQFKACPCRQAEKAGVRFVHDADFDRLNAKKRKAEQDLPLPSWVSLKQRFQERDGKIDGISVVDDQVESEPPSRYETPMPFEEPVLAEKMSESHDQSTLEAVEKAAEHVRSEEVPEVVSAVEAAKIPLPSPREDDLEPTAVLEEFTQVMIEPEPTHGVKPFTFSTSTSSNRHADVPAPILHQSQPAFNVTDELFDLAPPRRVPPRPSTAMGVLTVQSPIRVVTESPSAFKTSTASSSPGRARTMQVPLKESISPVRHNVSQRRSQSRPNIRSQSRGRSPGPAFKSSTSESPADATFLPIAPTAKHGQINHQRPQPTHQTQTTTTTVPLRGLESDDVFDPVHPDESFAESDRGRSTYTQDSPVLPNTLVGTPISREAALAQIRARRDRARSVNMKKAEEEAGRKTPKSAARRGLILERARDVSSVSNASAPSRF